MRFELQFLQPLVQPRLQVIGTLSGFPRVEFGIGLACLLLQFELLGAMIPVGDLLGQALLHGRFGLGNERDPAVPDFLEMLRHDVRHRIALCPLLQLACHPGALGPLKNGSNGRLVLSQRPVVEVGCVVYVAH